MNARRIVTIIALTAGLGGAALAQEMTPEQQADARTRVQTAVSLANIAMAEKDGEALAVAARLMASAGPVAKPGEKLVDGKPTLFDLSEMMKSAKDMGADTAKAEAMATSASPTVSPRDGYWYYSCDSFNNCQWIWAGY